MIRLENDKKTVETDCLREKKKQQLPIEGNVSVRQIQTAFIPAPTELDLDQESRK